MLPTTEARKDGLFQVGNFMGSGWELDIRRPFSKTQKINKLTSEFYSEKLIAENSMTC